MLLVLVGKYLDFIQRWKSVEHAILAARMWNLQQSIDETHSFEHQITFAWLQLINNIESHMFKNGCNY